MAFLAVLVLVTVGVALGVGRLCAWIETHMSDLLAWIVMIVCALLFVWAVVAVSGKVSL